MKTLTMRLLPSAFVIACATTQHMPRPQKFADSAQPACAGATWCAGADEADITPPLGLNMFGHGPESRIATAIQLRLRCQAFVIRGPQSKTRPALPNVVALVPCDLAAPGLLLQRSIAERVAKEVPLQPHQIMLMATHTHMAPAHYFAVEAYYGTFSGRLLGFDPAVLDFLANRIAAAIVRAYKNSVPAQLSWSQRPVDDAIGSNRSYPAYLGNHPTPAWLQKRVDAASEHAADKATDPMLAVLRIDRATAGATPADQREPIGLFAVFGVHPSALPNTNTAYTGDLFGYATREVRSEIQRSTKHDVIVGLANGIEGDVMVDRNAEGLREARRVGSTLAAAVLKSWNEPVPIASDAEPLAVAYRELELPGAHFALIDEETRKTPLQTLCQIPELGTPSGGGANDHPTSLRAFPQFNPGVRTVKNRDCEGHKLPVIMPGGRGEAGKVLPGTTPVSVIRIGPYAIVALPAEITTVAGIRVREAVARALDDVDGFKGNPELDDKNPHVVVVGLTNEYIQYVATEEEYDFQFYEGASTLYGPKSAEFFRTHAVCLARAHAGREHRCGVDQAQINETNDVEYSVPSTPPLLPTVEECRVVEHEFSNGQIAHELGGQCAVLKLTPAGSRPIVDSTVDGLARYGLEFTGPTWNGWIADAARVHVEVCATRRTKKSDPSCNLQDATERIDDDDGASVHVRFDPIRKVWSASWLPELLPPQSLATCGDYRIVVSQGLDRLVSDPIRWGCKPGETP